MKGACVIWAGQGDVQEEVVCQLEEVMFKLDCEGYGKKKAKTFLCEGLSMCIDLEQK